MGQAPIKFGLLGYGAFGHFHAEAIHLCEAAAISAREHREVYLDDIITGP